MKWIHIYSIDIIHHTFIRQFQRSAFSLFFCTPHSIFSYFCFFAFLYFFYLSICHLTSLKSLNVNPDQPSFFLFVFLSFCQLRSSYVIEGRLRSILVLFSSFRAKRRTDGIGMDGWDGYQRS